MSASDLPARTCIANPPLHCGEALRWLLDRLVKSAREITIAIVTEYRSTSGIREKNEAVKMLIKLLR